MIDSDYQRGRPQTMALRAKKARAVDRREVWDPRSRPAVRELLDHVAGELAAEYLRLIRQAAAKKGDGNR
jgi:hypothetical protein